VEYYRTEGKPRLLDGAERAKKAGRVIFSGMGTSEFAPETVIADLGQAGIDASTRDAGELLHYPRPVPGLLVLVSQSGESIETRKVAESVPARGGLIALVNNEESTIACAADLVLPMRAGHETAISTKTYVNTLAILYLMTQAMGGAGRLDAGLGELEELAGVMLPCDRNAIERAAALLADTGALHFIARGPATAAAKQCALTFMEGTQSSCTAFTGSAFRHGPFELVGPAHRAVFFISQGRTADLLTAMAEEVAEKGSRVVALANRPVNLPSDTCAVLRVPECAEELFPIAASTTQGFLLDGVARQRGVTAGEFRNAQKVTSRE
jgi:glucosamine--fructose-6-phosphate aminotransferase (isomerizing)